MGCGPSIEAPMREIPADAIVASSRSGSVLGVPKPKYIESFTILLVGAGDSGKSSELQTARALRTN